MSKPTRWWAIAALVMAGSTAAQPAPEPLLRQREVTVASPGAPAPEVHLAPDMPTLLLFDADIDKDSAVLDATRVQLVDAGARTLVLRLRVRLGADERLWLRVRFQDGSAPEEAVLALVSLPSEVDLQVRVIRQVQTLAGCQAKLAQTEARCGAGTLADLVASGVLDDRGVFTGPLIAYLEPETATAPASSMSGWIHAGPGWFVLALRIPLPLTEHPWDFQEAVLTPPRISSPGRLMVRGVRVKRATPQPGVLVVVEVLSPEPPAQGPYTLSLKTPAGVQPSMTLTVHLPSIPLSARSQPAEPAP